MSQEKININPDVMSEPVVNNSPATSKSSIDTNDSITSVWLEDGTPLAAAKNESKAAPAEDIREEEQTHESIVLNETTQKAADTGPATLGLFAAPKSEEANTSPAPIRGCCVMS